MCWNVGFQVEIERLFSFQACQQSHLKETFTYLFPIINFLSVWLLQRPLTSHKDNLCKMVELTLGFLSFLMVNFMLLSLDALLQVGLKYSRKRKRNKHSKYCMGTDFGWDYIVNCYYLIGQLLYFILSKIDKTQTLWQCHRPTNDKI